MDQFCFRMNFYCTKEKDKTVHVQNVITGVFGQHHVHTAKDFKKWSKGISNIKWLTNTSPCTCGLRPGEVRSDKW